MLKNRINYDTIQDLKRQTGRPIETLLAQTRHTDPFYLQAGRLLNARWFADLFHEYGFGPGTHLRRVHYRIVSQETAIRRPNGEPYENTAVCWQELCDAGKDARYAGFVDIEDFVDRRNPEAFTRLAESVDEPWIYTSDAPLEIGLPDEIPHPSLVFSGDCPVPYHVEIWSEKSTVNDVLEPLAERYGLNLQAALGEMSLTRCHEAVKRAAGNGARPVRILYVSDFDPAGQSMPVATSRKIEWLIRDGGFENIQLNPIVLTFDQCNEYRLPRTPIKETEARAAGFEDRFGAGATELDALEALHPGVLREILVAEIERFHDPDFASEWSDAVNEIEGDLDEVTEEVLGRHAEPMTALQDRLDLLRAEAAELAADIEAQNRIIEQELREAAPSVEDLLLPDPPDADEWEDPLFDSDRDYIAQIDRYKEFQGKPTERRAHGELVARMSPMAIKNRRDRDRNRREAAKVAAKPATSKRVSKTTPKKATGKKATAKAPAKPLRNVSRHVKPSAKPKPKNRR